MIFGRFVAFTLDLLVLALGGLAGFLVAVFTVPSTNTIAGMGNIVVFIALFSSWMRGSLGCAVVDGNSYRPFTGAAGNGPALLRLWRTQEKSMSLPYRVAPASGFSCCSGGRAE